MTLSIHHQLMASHNVATTSTALKKDFCANFIQQTEGKEVLKLTRMSKNATGVSINNCIDS